MAISLTQSNSAETNNVTSQAVTLSSTLAAGDLIIVAGRIGGTGTISASDGPGTTYAHVAASPKIDSNNNQAFLMWGILGSGQSALTVTVSITGSATRITVAAFDYHSTTGWNASPVDGSHSTATGSGQVSVATGQITTTATDLIFATVQLDTNPTTASQGVNSPFTIQKAGGTDGYASNERAWGGDDQGGVAGNYNCTFTWTTGAEAAAIIGAFTPSSTAGFQPDEDFWQQQPIALPEPIISVWG